MFLLKIRYLTISLAKAFANNSDLDETTRNGLSLLKSALCATFYQICSWTKHGVVQFSTWMSRLREIRQ